MKSPRASRNEAWRRLRAAQPPAWVLAHCRAVESLAAAMARRAAQRGLEVDAGLVQAGALLHDVGRGITQDVRHASLGAALLRQDGDWDERLVLIVERHTGAGITEEEAARLALPVQDYTPRTLEERIVAHADNLHSGPRRITMQDLEAKYRARGLDAAHARIEALHQELCRELDADLERMEGLPLPEPDA